ncbi:transposase [Heliophilum fasciatum]|uniref:Transposase n=1 Tax=Heliophilum fasciatum TaxID=35700 RepID=A0A4R2RE06_9FIRM|nr:transposase [Heliophilum fasciatum]
MDKTGLSPDVTAYISKLEAQVQEQSVRIDRLTDIVAKFQKTMYGQSSEKSKYVVSGENGLQIALFNEAEAEAKSKAPEPDKVAISGYTRKPKRTKEELAAELPVVEIFCELDKATLACNECGGTMRDLGKEMVREELEIIPAQVRLLRYVRHSYVCESCEKETGEATIVKAPTPAPVIKRSLASASTVAHVMYQKYVNGLPLYRQEKDWANHGIVLSRATLANWIIRSATDWLMPIGERMKSHLLAQPVVHADESVIQVLKEEGKKPSSESRMWVYCSGNTGTPPVVLFEYQPTRSGEHARRFLRGFQGYLQTDGYSGYDKVANVTRCGCWAHYPRNMIIREEFLKAA